MSTSLKPASAIPGVDFCLRTFLAQTAWCFMAMQGRQEREERQKVGRKVECVTTDTMWLHTSDNVSVFFVGIAEENSRRLGDLTIPDLEGVHNLWTDARSPQKCLTFEAMKQQKSSFSVPPAAVNFVSKKVKVAASNVTAKCSRGTNSNKHNGGNFPQKKKKREVD